MRGGGRDGWGHDGGGQEGVGGTRGHEGGMSGGAVLVNGSISLAFLNSRSFGDKRTPPRSGRTHTR